MNRAVRETRITRIVRHHADGRAIAVQFFQQSHHGFAVHRVQVSGRLVRQQYRRASRQCPRHCHTLLLTARKLRRIMLHAVRHSHLFQRLHHRLLAFRRRHAAISQRQFDILINVQIANQIKRLEDEADLAVANARALLHLQLRHWLFIQRVQSVARRIQQSENRQQRRFPAARGPRNRHIFAPLNIQMDARQRMRLYLIRYENLGDSVELDQRIVHRLHA